MHLSSTFSSDARRVRLRQPSWVPYFLTIVVLAELALRLPFVLSHLPKPEPTLWHAEFVQPKVDYLKAFELERGIDVLFIGNSTTQAGVNPQAFDIARGKRESVGPGSFNASVEGIPPYGALIFLQIFLQYCRPGTVYYGITPQDLNSNSPWARDVSDRIDHSPLALAESRHGLLGISNAILLQYSALYRYRSALFRTLLNGKPDPVPRVYFDRRGFEPSDRNLSQVPQGKGAEYFDKAGVLNYSVQGIQIESARNMATYLRDQGIRLVLVNMPLANGYFSIFDSPSDYEDYRSAISELASTFGVPLFDAERLSTDAGFDDTDFADLNHLNRKGAEKLSTMLGSHYPGVR